MDNLESFEIKPLAPGDDDAALEFCREVFVEMGWPQDKMGTNIAELFNEPDDIFITIKHGEEIVGTGGLLRLSKENVLLKRMYLAKRLRGSGLGTKLFAYLVEKAREIGHTMLVLDVSRTNTRATRFYEKQGMEEFFLNTPHPRWEGSSYERQKTDRYFRLRL